MTGTESTQRGSLPELEKGCFLIDLIMKYSFPGALQKPALNNQQVFEIGDLLILFSQFGFYFL